MGVMASRLRLIAVGLAVLALGALLATVPRLSVPVASGGPSLPTPATPIQHLVVIFDENISFDHYFGTYPHAANLPGETPFTAAGGTPAVDGLTAGLLTANPNSANPSRFTPANAITCGNDHNYTDEQKAFNNGLMNKFPENVGGGCGSAVMNYYDGNTVTGLWNLAQHFTMSDEYFDTTFGPSTPGALNLISGNTHGATTGSGAANGAIIADADPIGDDCGAGSNSMTGTNVGDLMNTAGMTWGWFQGGFRPTSTIAGKATCGASHKNAGGGTITDYSAHHEPFQYYASTANPHHLPPTSAAAIGQTDQANHQYDLKDFDTTVQNNNLPQVSFLKAAAFEDAHPGNSGPVDEQHWITRVVDEVEQSPSWANTAIVITYADSDGWYDHKFITPQQGSNDATTDALGGPAVCGPAPAVGDFLDRCGPGPRLPLVIVSPWVSPNTIHHTQREQTSILKFIEDNWLAGQRIGNQSFDQRANTLNTMFDFNVGDPRAPAVFLSLTNGTVVPTAPPGLSASPDGPPITTTTTSSSTTSSVTTTTTTTTSHTTQPPPKPFKPKLSSVSAKRNGKKVSVTIKLGNVSASRGKITVKVTLTHGKTTIAKGSGTVKKGKVSLTLTAKHSVKKGSYKLSISVSQTHKTAKLSKTLKLK